MFWRKKNDETEAKPLFASSKSKSLAWMLSCFVLSFKMELEKSFAIG